MRTIFENPELLVNRIRQLCSEQGVSLNQMEKSLGIRGTVARWADHAPSIDKVQLVADYFGITVSELLGEEIKTPASDDRDRLIDALSTLREEERALLQVAKGMTAEDVAAVTDFIKKLKGTNAD